MYSDREKNRKMHPEVCTKAFKWNKSIAKNVIYIPFYISLWCFLSDWIIWIRFSPLYLKNTFFSQLFIRKNSVHSVICVVTSSNSCGIRMFFFSFTLRTKNLFEKHLPTNKIWLEFHWIPFHFSDPVRSCSEYIKTEGIENVLASTMASAKNT